MESRGIVNFAAKVKDEPNEMCYNENDNGGTIEQAPDTEISQCFRYVQENFIHTLKEHKGMNEFQPNQEIKVEFECKDVKPKENLLVLNKGFHKFQSKQIKAEVECKDEKPNVNLLVSDETNKGSHQFQPKNEIEIEFECKDFEPNLNLSVPNEIETEGTIKKEFLSDTQKTIEIKTVCKLNGQNNKIDRLVNSSKQSAECDASLKNLSAKVSVEPDINSEDNTDRRINFE
ncbi:hypothetical protein TKK_0005154 [Trichogramma kaykai]